MIPEDLLVSTVALLLGGLMIVVAIGNWDWYYELPKARWLQQACGRTGVRVIYALLGLLLLVIGLVIAAGWV